MKESFDFNGLKTAPNRKNKNANGGTFNSITMLPKIVDSATPGGSRRQTFSQCNMMPLRKSVPAKGNLLNAAHQATMNSRMLTPAGQ